MAKDVFPIPKEYEQVMHAAASVLDETLNPQGEPKNVVFVLLVGNVNTRIGNFISNGAREDAVFLMEEILKGIKQRASSSEEKQ